MNLVSDREGRIRKEYSLLDCLLEAVYRYKPGRMLLRPLVTPAVSKICGKFLDSGISCVLIAPFIRFHSMDLTEFELKRYDSYNDFFKRKLNPGARTIARDADALISPCDGRLSVFKMDETCSFTVKNTEYTAESLLRNQKLAQRYAGGYAWIFRLCVEDYHRYVYVDHGRVSGLVRIPGFFHTVKPAALRHVPVYKENTREYCLLKSENFGTVLQMEVGALLVGKIENGSGGRLVSKGEEKGNFAFGGSTIILMTQKGTVVPAGDILRNSRQGREVKVKLGEQIGKKKNENVFKI